MNYYLIYFSVVVFTLCLCNLYIIFKLTKTKKLLVNKLDHGVSAEYQNLKKYPFDYRSFGQLLEKSNVEGFSIIVYLKRVMLGINALIVTVCCIYFLAL